MKAILTLQGLAVLILMNVSFSAIAQDDFFKIKGVVMSNEKKQEDAVVRLFKFNEKIDSVYTPKSGKFSFVLSANADYFIEIEKYGYEKSIVKINTRRKKLDPANEGSSYSLNVEAEIFPEIGNKKGREEELDLLDFPVAIVEYDAKNDEFVNNMKYSKYIKSEIKKIKVASKK
jgi:hypothetical protein